MIRIFLLIFADDMVIIAETTCTSELQSMLMRNGCTMNSNWMIHIHSSILVCYLTSMEIFSKQKNMLLNNVIRHCLQYIKNIKSRWKIIFFAQCSVFYTNVHSILSHACEIRGFYEAPVIEKVHLNFCNKVIGVNKNLLIWCIVNSIYPLFTLEGN